jgi:hypothetical protein
LPGASSPAALTDFALDLPGGNLFAASQLLQARLNLRVQALTQSLAVLAQFKPFQQRIRLILVQALDFFDGQFNPAHGANLSKSWR